MVAREFRIVVTGGRNFYDEAALTEALDALRPTRVAQGGCPTGADAIARDWCAENEVECVTYEADWEKHGRAAGPLRSAKMIDEEKPHLVLATNGGNGTKACVRYARKVCRVVLGVVS